MKKLFIVTINSLILLIIINFIIVFFPEKIIKKKYINEKLISYLGLLYHVYYTDTFNRNLNEIESYSVIVGDSYALGSGENKKNDGIAYYFKKNNPKKDFFQIGYPAGPYDFQEKILNKIVKKIEKKPEKIFLFVYEGNDFYDELSYGLKKNDEIFLKKFKLNIYNYLPIFAYPLERTYNKIFFPALKKQSSESKDILNEIIIDKEKIKIKHVIQNACSSLQEEQKKAFRITFTNYLSIINFKYPEVKKILVYIPSPASLYNYEKKIYSKNYLNNNLEVFSKTENFNCHKNLVEFVSKTVTDLKFDNLFFFNTTPHLQKITKNELLHGLKDFNHFNTNGYKNFAEILLSLERVF